MLTKTYVQDWSPESVLIERTPSQFAVDSLLYVQEAGQFECYDQYYFEHESLHSFLMLYTERGEGEHYGGGQHHSLRSGDLLFADCMTLHSCQSAQNGPWSFLWVNFNGVNAPAYYEQFTKAGAHVISPSVPNEIQRCLHELIQVNQSEDPFAELISSDLITHLLTLVLMDAKAAPAARSHVPGFIEEALRDINTHLCDDLTLDHFARTLGVNKYHLQKEFKRHVGMSPNAYVCNARINMAKSLLLSNDLTVSHVAEQAGFRNVGHFMNMFKRATGMTPGEYRRHGKTGVKIAKVDNK